MEPRAQKHLNAGIALSLSTHLLADMSGGRSEFGLAGFHS